MATISTLDVFTSLVVSPGMNYEGSVIQEALVGNVTCKTNMFKL